MVSEKIRHHARGRRRKLVQIALPEVKRLAVPTLARVPAGIYTKTD